MLQQVIHKSGRTFTDFRNCGHACGLCTVISTNGSKSSLVVWFTDSVRKHVRAMEYATGESSSKEVNYFGIPLEVRKSLKAAAASKGIF